MNLKSAAAIAGIGPQSRKKSAATWNSVTISFWPAIRPVSPDVRPLEFRR